MRPYRRAEDQPKPDAYGVNQLRDDQPVMVDRSPAPNLGARRLSRRENQIGYIGIATAGMNTPRVPDHRAACAALRLSVAMIARSSSIEPPGQHSYRWIVTCPDHSVLQRRTYQWSDWGSSASASGASRPYHHGELDRAAIDGAVEEVETVGVAAVSMRRIARRAGVSHAALAYQFGDKAGIFTAVATEGFRLQADDRRPRPARMASCAVARPTSRSP